MSNSAINRATYTPGPWVVIKNEIHDRMEITSPTRENWIGSVNVEHHHTDISVAESMANARLIAAAPELLEYLRNLLTFEGKTLDRLACNSIRQLLASVEGSHGDK